MRRHQKNAIELLNALKVRCVAEPLSIHQEKCVLVAAEDAIDAAVSRTTNYVADKEVLPTKVTFENGREVVMVWDDDDGAYLDVKQVS